LDRTSMIIGINAVGGIDDELLTIFIRSVRKWLNNLDLTTYS